MSGRPKGKNYFSTSIALTKKQKEWLTEKPNRSELLRKVLDALISVDEATPEYNDFARLKLKLEGLNEKLSEIQQQRINVLILNRGHFKGDWANNTNPLHLNEREYHIENSNDPTPIDDEGELLRKEWEICGKAIEQVETEIQKIKSLLLDPRIELK